MPYSSRFLVVITSSAVATFLIAGDGAGTRCSLAPFPSQRGTQTTYLLGNAAADTVLTGPGEIEPSAEPGHVGSGGARSIYGQVIEINRFGGADSVALAASFAQQRSRAVVIVPWDYDAGCRPARWSGSVRWVPPGKAGMFTVKLRRVEEWASGMPTFDALFADGEPYPLGIRYQRELAEVAPGAPAALSAAEFFDLYRDLPEGQTIADRPAETLALLDDWERAHPELAQRPPAPRILDDVRRTIYRDRARRALQSIVPRIGGTYRITFALGEGPERTFYARTRSLPTTEWPVSIDEPMVDPRAEPPRPDAYFLLASGAPTPDSLPQDCTGGRRGWREGYFGVVDPPPTAGETRRDLHGSVDLRFLGAQFAADSVLWRFAITSEQERFARRGERSGRHTPAHFTVGADGVYRVAQTITLADGRSLTLHGERISTATIACSW